MKPQKSKHDQRQALSELIQRYVESGGEVKHIPRGTSGNESNINLFQNKGGQAPKTERTPVTEAVQALEERKGKKISNEESAKKSSKRPTKRLIVDDFGEPVRWVWED